MTSLQSTIREYRAGCEQLEQRIRELEGEIGAYGAKQPPVSLLKRRLALCYELWDMQRAVFEMRDYLRQIGLRNASDAQRETGRAMKQDAVERPA